jgi:hypothetical protein
MEWIDIKTQTPPKDTTVLGYNNGAFVLVTNYNGILIDELCTKVNIEYWCEITPPIKNKEI